MPELPQMQALAERVDAAVAGAIIARVEPLGFSGLKTVLPPGEGLEGETLLAVGRRGKYLVLTLSSGRRVLVHLSQAGRLDIEEPFKHTKPRGAVVRFVFGNGTAVLVREHANERKAVGGCWPPVRKGLWAASARAAGEGFRGSAAHERGHAAFHTLLRDQRFVAGIGRGYADDALNRAGLSPFSPSSR